MTDDEHHTPASWTAIARERMAHDAAPRARRVARAFAYAVVKTGQGLRDGDSEDAER